MYMEIFIQNYDMHCCIYVSKNVRADPNLQYIVLKQGRHDQQMRSFERGYVFELCLILKYLFTKQLHIKDPKYFKYFEMSYN